MNIFNIVLLEPLANGLVLFYHLLGGNMGLAIIGFSLFLRVVLSPLTKPYMESMRKMKDLGPQLAKLKKKHGGDKVKFAQAQADFYKQKGVNPGAGCLPYLLQIVVLIAFFNVFSRTISAQGNIVDNLNAFLYKPLRFASDASINTRFLYLDVTKPDTISLFGKLKFPGPVLFLAAIAQLLSALVTSPQTQIQSKIAKKTPGSTDDFQTAMQKSMIFTFPLFTLFIGMRFASGLALYWLVFSATQVYQQVKSSGWGDVSSWFKKANLLELRLKSLLKGK